MKLKITEVQKKNCIALANKTAYVVYFHDYDLDYNCFYVNKDGFIIRCNCIGPDIYKGKRLDIYLLLNAHGVVFIGPDKNNIYTYEKFKGVPTHIDIIINKKAFADRLIYQLDKVMRSLKITTPDDVKKKQATKRGKK